MSSQLRTPIEILSRIKELQESDMFGFQTSNLIYYLDYDLAKEFLKDDCKPEDWGDDHKLTKEKVLEEMKNYMTFAWEKCRGHRGLSSGRSVEHYQAWVWLLGEEDYEDIDWESYQNYGAPILMKICLKYGFDIPDSVEIKRMSNGDKCVLDCSEGCC